MPALSSATLTLVLGLGCDLCKELDEVWKVIAEELSTDHQVLTGVVGLEGGAEELRLACYPKSRSFLGRLGSSN
jgi:hypothetical protein